MMKNYEINEKEETITFYQDRDTGKQETASISELVELLFWLRSREDDLRHIAFNYSPITKRQTLSLQYGYYVGRLEDMRLVKVARARYEEVLINQEAYMRRSWLAAKQAEHNHGYLDRLEINIQRVDDQGRPINSYKEPVPTLEDTPIHLIQARLNEVQTPEWWVDKADNLDLGKYAKLP